jgi:hypothetical protein
VSTIEPLEGRTLLAAPLVSVANSVVRERNTGSVGYANVTVTLAKRATSLVKIGYSTKAGTATAGSDFVASTGTLRIAAGEKSGTIRIKIVGDDTIEGSEKFYVRLTSAVHATLPTPNPIAIVRIADSIPAPGPISNNLSGNFAGVQAAGTNNLLAASFIAPAGGITLKQLTLKIARFDNSVAIVRVFSDGFAGSGPLGQVAQFTPTSTLPTSVAPVTFVNALGVALIPSRKYWVVLSGLTGSINWAQTNASTGSGTGFTGEWAQSVDGGGHWSLSTSLPLQMQVGA